MDGSAHIGKILLDDRARRPAEPTAGPDCALTARTPAD